MDNIFITQRELKLRTEIKKIVNDYDLKSILITLIDALTSIDVSEEMLTNLKNTLIDYEIEYKNGYNEVDNGEVNNGEVNNGEVNNDDIIRW